MQNFESQQFERKRDFKFNQKNNLEEEPTIHENCDMDILEQCLDDDLNDCDQYDGYKRQALNKPPQLYEAN